MVNRISGYSLNHSIHTSPNRQQKAATDKPNEDADLHLEGKPQNSAIQSNINDKIEVSLEAQKAARNAMLSNMQFQEIASPTQSVNAYSQESTLLEVDVVLPSREQLHDEFAERMSNRVPLDPFDNEFHINNVTYGFPESNIFISYNQHIKVAEMLEGKARNATLAASELVNSLQGSIFYKDSTISERAIMREAAFQSAQYIADNFFENPNEAKDFMELITKIRDDDILREKGWIVNDHFELLEPYRNYSAPGRQDDYISPMGTARHLGASEEIWRVQTKAIEFIVNEVSKRAPLHSETDALNRDANLKDEIFTVWHKNEREAGEAISKVLSDFNNDVTVSYLQRILKAF